MERRAYEGSNTKKNKGTINSCARVDNIYTHMTRISGGISIPVVAALLVAVVLSMKCERRQMRVMEESQCDYAHSCL